MNQPKRHHYVPVMILKHFTDDGGWLYHCHWDDAKPKINRTRPKGAFVVKHLYTKHDSSGNPDTSVEKDLGVVEGDAAPVINKIIECSLNGNYPHLSPGEKGKLGKFIFHQYKRTPEDRLFIDKKTDGWLAEALSAFENERGQKATPEELAEFEAPKYRQRVRQNAFSAFAGEPLTNGTQQCFEECPIQFGVIRIENESFVIGSHIRTSKWFPVHKQVAFKFVGARCSNELIEFHDMSEIRRINEQTVRDSMTFAGSSEQLVRSLAGSR